MRDRQVFRGPTNNVLISAEQILDGIDYAFLRDFFARELRRSGQDARYANVLVRKNFSASRGLGAPRTNPLFKKARIGMSNRSSRSTLWSVCHEAAHLVAAHGLAETGFQDVFDGFQLFNEGMTDLIARDVYIEYVQARDPSLTASEATRRVHDIQRGYGTPRKLPKSA